MVYMGSKRRYCKDIVPIIQKYIKDNNIEVFIDCFVGGANLSDKIDCSIKYGIDLSPTLISLHKQAQEDFGQIAPDCIRADWDAAKEIWNKIKAAITKGESYPLDENSMPLYQVGAIEFYASFANGGFPRGYAKPSDSRNYYQEAYRNHSKQKDEAKYKDINFLCGDYINLVNKLKEEHKDKNILLYCDAPYKGTKPYGISNKFDYERYYDWLRTTHKEIPIFVSEQYLPNDFEVYRLWTKEATRTCGKDNNFKASETLWLLEDK